MSADSVDPQASIAPLSAIPVALPAAGVHTLPYASGTLDAGIARRGRLLVTGRNQALPALCVKCNKPASGKPLRCKMTWHHPALYLTILAGLLIYVIVALIVQKSAVVHASLCERHRRRRRAGVLAGLAVFLVGIAWVIMSVQLADVAHVLLAALLILFGLVIVLIFQPVLRPVRIDDCFVWAKGCCDEFLAPFPHMP